MPRKKSTRKARTTNRSNVKHGAAKSNSNPGKTILFQVAIQLQEKSRMNLGSKIYC